MILEGFLIKFSAKSWDFFEIFRKHIFWKKIFSWSQKIFHPKFFWHLVRTCTIQKSYFKHSVGAVDLFCVLLENRFFMILGKCRKSICTTLLYATLAMIEARWKQRTIASGNGMNILRGAQSSSELIIQYVQMKKRIAKFENRDYNLISSIWGKKSDRRQKSPD